MIEESKQITIVYHCGRCEDELGRDLYCNSCKYQFDNGEIGHE